MSSNKVTQELKQHYKAKFLEHGETAKGVDWRDQETMELRYEKMANVQADATAATWLDVGCGFGGFGNWLLQKNPCSTYYGIDVVEELAVAARRDHGHEKVFVGDFLEWNTTQEFDFVICNGILTQKLTTSLLEMDDYAYRLIGKMFSLSKNGIAFNIMSSYVNFFAPNLYYKNPAEVLVNCASRFGHKIKIDHSYGLYEFTIYIYK